MTRIGFGWQPFHVISANAPIPSSGKRAVPLIQKYENVESPMNMTATIELEFESAGETTQNAMDAALIRGLEALKKASN